jgi:hypothetical protein
MAPRVPARPRALDRWKGNRMKRLPQCLYDLLKTTPEAMGDDPHISGEESQRLFAVPKMFKHAIEVVIDALIVGAPEHAWVTEKVKDALRTTIEAGILRGGVDHLLRIQTMATAAGRFDSERRHEDLERQFRNPDDDPEFDDD